MKLTISQIVEQLKQRSACNLDFKANTRDVRISGDMQCATIKGKEYPLDDTGRETLCRTLGIPKSYFKRYPINTEIAEHANTLLQSKPDTEVLVRTAGDTVRAVLYDKYAIFDHHQALGALEAVQEKLVDHSVGVLIGTSSRAVFQILFGAPKMQLDETYPMIRVVNSEVGLSDLEVEMGLFRVVCTNGAVIQSKSMGYFSWSHSQKTLQKLNTFILHSVERGLQACLQLQETFEAAREVPLTLKLENLMLDLVERGKSSSRFAEGVLASNEAVPVTTKFELVNLITAQAQKEKNWSSQRRYERLGMDLLNSSI